MIQLLRKNLGIHTKITLFVILVVVSVLSLAMYASRKMVTREAQEHLRERYIAIVKQLETSIETHEELRDTAALKEELSKLPVDPNIARLEILEFSPPGLVVRATYGESPEPLTTPLSDAEVEEVRQGKIFIELAREDEDRYWDILAPIEVHKERIGLIRARILSHRLDAVEFREQTRAFLVTVVSGLVILAFLLGYLRRSVTQPIRTLLDAMERAEAGDLQAVASVRSQDELGRLAGQFNRMLATIRKGEEQVRRFNKELQAKVEQATRELNARYKDLMAVNRKLYEAQSRLAHSERLAAAGQVAAAVAHRIGTPMTSILGHLHRFKQEASAEKREERIKIIESQIERVVQTIRELLNSVRNPPRMHPVEINRLLTDLLDLVMPGITLREIRLKKTFDPKLPDILADADQLQEVFLNLLINAIDAMPNGGELELVTEYQTDGVSAREWIVVTVGDTGCGISEADLAKVFEPFFTTKEKHRGTGLGLSICKEIVEAHQGEVRIESVVGAGTRLIVFFPVHRGR